MFPDLYITIYNLYRLYIVDLFIMHYIYLYVLLCIDTNMIYSIYLRLDEWFVADTQLRKSVHLWVLQIPNNCVLLKKTYAIHAGSFLHGTFTRVAGFGMPKSWKHLGNISNNTVPCEWRRAMVVWYGLRHDAEKWELTNSQGNASVMQTTPVASYMCVGCRASNFDPHHDKEQHRHDEQSKFEAKPACPELSLPEKWGIPESIIFPLLAELKMEVEFPNLRHTLKWGRFLSQQLMSFPLAQSRSRIWHGGWLGVINFRTYKC